MNKLKRFSLLFALGLLTACGGGGASSEPPPLQGARMGGAFTLINQDGKTVSDRDFKGRYRLIYFGYSFCPDVCPTDVAVMGKALQLFEKADKDRAEKVTPIFITVDPARDTPAVLKQFVGHFHPRMIGLTGSVAQIDDVAQRYGIPFMRAAPNAQGAYLVDHARLMVLYGPQGEPIAIMPPNAGPDAADKIAAELARWVN
ncbi:MAG: SCO family protein [Chakrabartia sp.]